MALKGDVMAMRLCLERILPARRDRLIELDLPPAESAKQVSAAFAALLTAIGKGEITPAEGETLSRILSAQAPALNMEDIERRLEELERRTTGDPAGDGAPDIIQPS